jgi:hypothetical protein
MRPVGIIAAKNAVVATLAPTKPPIAVAQFNEHGKRSRENSSKKKLTHMPIEQSAKEQSAQLTTALQAAQSRIAGKLSTNPTGVSEGLVRGLHVRLTNLKRFHLQRRGDFDVVTPEYLHARAEKAAAILDALRKYIEQDHAEQAKRRG